MRCLRCNAATRGRHDCRTIPGVRVKAANAVIDYLKSTGKLK